MKNQANYTITLGFSPSDQKLIAQLHRESKGALYSLDAVVYKLAMDGIRAKLQAQHDENVAKYNGRKKGKNSGSEAKPEAVVETQPTAKSEVNPEAVAEVQSTAQSSENAQ